MSDPRTPPARILVVRANYVDPSHGDGFTAELELNDDGLLVRYEHLAHRV